MKSLQQLHKGTKIEADRYNRTDVGSHTNHLGVQAHD